MRINHNIAALNTYRQLNSASGAQSKSMEKLSSGLAINRAGDNAAGLAISEKMRSQIRGLDQAGKNAQDGISLIQTAEGALNETHDILQRMRELATQAANDTNIGSDRQEIQKEMNQLTSEINRIGNNTEFNTQKVLKGGASTPLTYSGGTVGDKQGDASGLTISLGSYAGGNLDDVAVDTSGITNSGSLGGTITVGTGADATVFDVNADGTTTVQSGSSSKTFGGITISGVTASIASGSGTGSGSFDITGRTSSGGGTGQFSATLQIGANEGQSFSISINDMRAKALGVAGTTATGSATGSAAFAAATDADSNSNALTDVSATGTPEYALDVTDNTKASAAITVIDNAIKKVSGERSKLGAYQNRLEHTINNLGTSSENLTAAESRIRDVDMAKEMMNQTKNSILSQAAQAMLAQANQQPQGVLQLLR